MHECEVQPSMIHMKGLGSTQYRVHEEGSGKWLRRLKKKERKKGRRKEIIKIRAEINKERLEKQ